MVERLSFHQWTHGTQVTASHGHFAFFDAYVMVNLTAIYFAVPQIKGIKLVSDKLSLIALRVMVLAMFLIALALGVADVVQVYLQRILGLDYLTTQEYMKLWYSVFWASGWVFAGGTLMYIVVLSGSER